jgi:hypothetical protein
MHYHTHDIEEGLHFNKARDRREHHLKAYAQKADPDEVARVRGLARDAERRLQQAIDEVRRTGKPCDSDGLIRWHIAKGNKWIDYTDAAIILGNNRAYVAWLRSIKMIAGHPKRHVLKVLLSSVEVYRDTRKQKA